MYHKLIQQLAARASIIETFRKKRDSSSNTRREKRTLLPIYSSRPSYNCDKSVVSHLLRITLRVSFDNMRSVPLGKINIYNVYSMAVFSSSIFLSFFLWQTNDNSSLFILLHNLKRKAYALSLSLINERISSSLKRIVIIFINTCPFSLAPAIWFFSYHRKQKKISRRLAHLFGLVSPQATSRRTAPGRRFSLSACTRVSRRTFSRPETF